MRNHSRKASEELECWMTHCHNVCREHGATGPSRFERMRKDYLTLRAMEMLVEWPDIQSGLTWCWENNLLKYSVEAAVVKFAHEFDPKTLECAKRRLRQYGHPVV